MENYALFLCLFIIIIGVILIGELIIDIGKIFILIIKGIRNFVIWITKIIKIIKKFLKEYWKYIKENGFPLWDEDLY